MCRIPIISLLLSPVFVAADPPPPAEVKSSAVDSYGDPLPTGAIARLGTVRLRHGSYSIQALAFTPDGKTLASAGYEGMLRFWDTATAKPLTTVGS
jgi:WD40 repeat protein